MPESPEVCTIADAVNKYCPQVFETAEIIENVPGKKHRYSRKAPKNWDKIHEHQFTLTGARTKGKLILLDIVTTRNKTKWVGLATMGMSGDMQWGSSEEKHCRYAFLGRMRELGYTDQRCFGTFRLVTPEEAAQAEKKIGWDLLQGPMDPVAWKKLQQHKKIKDRPVGVVLLDQNLFAGIGNIYKCETLYELNIDPTTLVNDLAPDKWNQINTTSHNILQKAYKLGGSSVRDYTADGKEGKAQTILKIYGKVLCPKKHKVKKIKQGKGSQERTTWFCQECILENT